MTPTTSSTSTTTTTTTTTSTTTRATPVADYDDKDGGIGLEEADPDNSKRTVTFAIITISPTNIVIKNILPNDLSCSYSTARRRSYAQWYHPGFNGRK